MSSKKIFCSQEFCYCIADEKEWTLQCSMFCAILGISRCLLNYKSIPLAFKLDLNRWHADGPLGNWVIKLLFTGKKKTNSRMWQASDLTIICWCTVDQVKWSYRFVLVWSEVFEQESIQGGVQIIFGEWKDVKEIKVMWENIKRGMSKTRWKIKR